MLFGGYEVPLSLLRQELIQLEEEGYIVSQAIKDKVAAYDCEKDAWNDELELIYKELENLPRQSDFKYVEPDELDEIRALRPAERGKAVTDFDHEALLDKMHGAYTGRFVGCALGQVVEGWPMDKIKDYLQKVDNYPLHDFISRKAVPPEEDKNYAPATHASWKENICCMGPDDDVSYTLIGLHVMERCGRDFSWVDVAEAWNRCLPYDAICTAETQAILNFNMRSRRYSRKHCSVVTPQFTRRFNNPYREWIGAQIRADGWAYCAAGNPELAAEYAYRDASWTHVKNGIYGEMFFAAMIAASFAERNLDRLIDIALGEIPENCRLAEGIRLAQKWCRELPDFTAFVRKLDETYPTMSAVHTINNAMICIMALYYGEMNPDRSIAISVMAGKDTDCNGATVGSIVGAIAGYKNFGGTLAAQLNDRVRPDVFGFRDTSMRELAERTLKVWQS